MAAQTALTTEQLAAARTTLQYNVLGQLVAKIDPETFVTAENGYRYRARPTTRYGYDLLGRHTTTTDANGNLSRSQYAPGASDEEAAATFDAAGGAADAFNVNGGSVTRYGRDVFGDVRKITDALGGVVLQDYDAMGRVTTVTRKDVTRADINGAVSNIGDLKDTYVYDELGQRIRTTNALDNQKAAAQQLATTADYDALGRVVTTVTAGGARTDYLYTLKQASDAAILAMDGAVGAASGLTAITRSGGYIKTTRQADGRSQVDEVEYFGHVTRHTDLSGAVFTYQFNSAGQLVRETSTVHAGQTLGKDVSYTYYANGYIQGLRDNSLLTSAEYAYDNAGNRTYEAYFKLDPTKKDAKGNPLKLEAYQNSTITYDELNRISRVRDANLYDIRYEFDAVGNRRLVDSIYKDGIGGLWDRQTYWYAYDALNRFNVTKGRLSSTSTNTTDINRFATATRGTSLTDTAVRIEAGTDGTLLSYDKLSRRASAEYSFNGQAIKELYGYSSDGFLQSTSQNGTLVATRGLDALGRTVKAKDLVNLQETQTDYDADHRLTQQRFFDGRDASRSHTLDFAYYDTVADSTASLTGRGALAKTVLKPTTNPAASTATVYSYEYWDSAQQSQVAKIPVNGSAGYNYSYYDANGHIQRTQDASTYVSNTYVTTASGLVLQRDRSGYGSSRHAFYYADDHRIGDVSDTPDDLQRVSYAEQLAVRSGAAQRRQYYRLETVGQANVRGNRQDGDGAMSSTIDVTRARSTADFDQNYEPINDSYPSQAGSAYTVRSDKETLYSIAQAVWGDRAMWYLIAEANGLQANATLKAGQLLLIPNKVANIHNNSQTWRPYNAGEAIGPTDPMLPYYAATAADPLASVDALLGPPHELLEQALSQATSYNPDDNPANWGSGGGDRMGDYAFIEQWSGHHNNPYIGTSPNNATYGRGLNEYMQAVATRNAQQAAQTNPYTLNGRLGENGARSRNRLGQGQDSTTTLPPGSSDAAGNDSEVRRLLARSMGSAGNQSQASDDLATISWSENGQPFVFTTTTGQVNARSAVLAAQSAALSQQVPVSLGSDGMAYARLVDAPPVVAIGQRAISAAESYSLAASSAGEFALLGYGSDPEYTAAIAAGMGGIAGRLAQPAAFATQRIVDIATATKNDPRRAAYGAVKGVVNFVPEAANLTINAVKLSLNGYSYLFGDAGASFRSTSAWNLPVWETQGDAELGGSLISSLASPWAYGRAAQLTGKAIEVSVAGVRDLAANLREAGLPDWNIQWNDSPLGTAYSNPLVPPLKLEKVGNTSRSALSVEDRLVLQGDASRAQIVQAIGTAAQPSIRAILALDPEAQVGFRGSLANGLKNDTKLGPNGERVPFDGFVASKVVNGKAQPYTGPQGYDADFFVVSDRLAEELGRKSFFRNAADLDASLDNIFENFGKSMQTNPILGGMKVETPTFRIFSSHEIQKKLDIGDAQIYFIQGQKE